MVQSSYMEKHFPELVRPSTLFMSHVKKFLGQGERAAHIHYDPDTSVSDIEFRHSADKATRRIHFKDVEKYIGPDAIRATNWLKHLDPITITNFAIWTDLHGYEAFQVLLDGGLFNSLEAVMERGSALSSYVKRFTHDPHNLKQAFAEVNVLTGFLNNDVIPVDWVTKMMELAHGGEEHGIDQSRWLETFSESLADISKGFGAQPQMSCTLLDYIKSGKWITAGSSTIGEVKWTYDDKRGRFKARKNMVQYLYTPQELYDIVMSWNGVTVSVAFAKNEIAKRRLAVASNFESYILDSYMLHLYGDGWKHWSYITLDETPREAQNRTAKVSHLMKKGHYALPFDYDAFDHQAQTTELLIIVRKFIDSISVPPSYRETWTQIKRLILSGYERGIMRIITSEGRVVETKVTGGLPSGVRLTSLIGNVWNATVTNMVLTLAATLTGGVRPEAVGVRGDDTYIISESPAYLGLVRRLYQALNARGKDSKFGIATKICEFLRNEISPEGQRGWSNRSITSVTQRKPWTSAPWQVDQQVTISRLAIDTLSRRVRKDCSFLHRANTTKWSRFYRQSSDWLRLPRRLGGLGVYEDKGMRPSGKLPLTIEDRVRYPNLNPTSPPWASMSREEQLEFSRLEMTRRLSTDDIPKASLKRKDELIDLVRKTVVTWHQEKPIEPMLATARCPSPTRPALWPVKHRPSREEFLLPDGQKLLFEEALSTASSVARAKKISVREVLQPMFPFTWDSILDWERKGWHRTDAINLVLGKTPTELTFPLHPELTPFVQEVIDKRCRAWVGRANIARKLYGYTRGAVRSIIDQGGSIVYSY